MRLIPTAASWLASEAVSPSVGIIVRFTLVSMGESLGFIRFVHSCVGIITVTVIVVLAVEVFILWIKVTVIPVHVFLCKVLVLLMVPLIVPSTTVAPAKILIIALARAWREIEWAATSASALGALR